MRPPYPDSGCALPIEARCAPGTAQPSTDDCERPERPYVAPAKTRTGRPERYGKNVYRYLSVTGCVLLAGARLTGL